MVAVLFVWRNARGPAAYPAICEEEEKEEEWRKIARGRENKEGEEKMRINRR